MFLAVQCDVRNRHTIGVGDCKRVTSHQRCTQTFLRTQHRHWNQWTVVQLDEMTLPVIFNTLPIFIGNSLCLRHIVRYHHTFSVMQGYRVCGSSSSSIRPAKSFLSHNAFATMLFNICTASFVTARITVVASCLNNMRIVDMPTVPSSKTQDSFYPTVIVSSWTLSACTI